MGVALLWKLLSYRISGIGRLLVLLVLALVFTLTRSHRRSRGIPRLTLWSLLNLNLLRLFGGTLPMPWARKNW
jgi:hypothetical protein